MIRQILIVVLLSSCIIGKKQHLKERKGHPKGKEKASIEGESKGNTDVQKMKV